MALNAQQAQAYFNSIPKSEQDAVTASGADITAWANASYNAGDPRALKFDPTVSQTATDATTGKTPQGLRSSGDPTPIAPGATPTPAQLRYRAKQERWSDDLERFSDAQLAAWLNSGLYDPNTGKFRSENDPSGQAIYDKPAECPQGTTFHGNKCVSWNDLPAWAGGGGGGYVGPSGGPGGAPKPSGMPSSDDPLQNALVGLYQERGGTFGGSDTGQSLKSGGIWWTGAGQALPQTPKAQAATATAASAVQAAAQPAKPTPVAQTSALQSGGGWQQTGQLETSLKNAGVTAPAQPAAPSPLNSALMEQRRGRDPNDWWRTPRTA